MSRTELHVGTLRKVEYSNATLEELCKSLCEELGIEPYEGYNWYQTLTTECWDYIAHNGELYRVEDKELEEGTVDVLTKNEDGTFSYIQEFWNGGTCLFERLENSLQNLNK